MIFKIKQSLEAQLYPEKNFLPLKRVEIMELYGKNN